MHKIRIAFLVSHRGSNMQAVINACKDGRLNAVPAALITNNPSSQAIQRAIHESIPYCVANPESLYESHADHTMLGFLLEHRVDLVILAGYMKKVTRAVLDRFAGRIINIHPSLLPCYGGKGMYGQRVHEAVLAAGESESGATVHLVDEEYDRGPILAQQKVQVMPNDTPASLAARVLEVEHELLVETVARITRGEILRSAIQDNID